MAICKLENLTMGGTSDPTQVGGQRPGSPLESLWCESTFKGCRSWCLVSTGDGSRKNPPAQEELSLHVQASFPHLPLFVPSGPPAIGQCHPHSRQVCSPQVTDPCANYVWKHFHRLPEVCFTSFLGVSVQSS